MKEQLKILEDKKAHMLAEYNKNISKCARAIEDINSNITITLELDDNTEDVKLTFVDIQFLDFLADTTTRGLVIQNVVHLLTPRSMKVLKSYF